MTHPDCRCSDILRFTSSVRNRLVTVVADGMVESNFPSTWILRLLVDNPFYPSYLKPHAISAIMDS